MSKELAILKNGESEPACDDVEVEENIAFQLPDDIDIAKFNHGRNFFKKNVGQCLIAMLFSLICIDIFLKVLVSTGMSSTPASSCKRYTRTVVLILNCHYGDVWNPSSSAYKSVHSVRKVHKYARKFMHSKENILDKHKSGMETENKNINGDRIYLSQYEMGLVLSGFMGCIVMYPDTFGIGCSIDDLDGYVYFWRWIGYLLGIKDQYNICVDGYDKANTICHAIEHEILIRCINANDSLRFCHSILSINTGQPIV